MSEIDDELNDTLRTPSMGALVEQPICRICGTTHSDLVRHLDLKDGEVLGVSVGHVNFIGASMVKAPKCWDCGESLRYTGKGTWWSCVKEGCVAMGELINPGFGGVVS